jgi:hypothetical protein
LGSWERACFDSQTGHINAYVLLKFQRINKQKAAKPIVDYFQRVCDAKIMHVTLSRDQMSRKLTNHYMLWLGKRLIEFLISCHSLDLENVTTF